MIELLLMGAFLVLVLWLCDGAQKSTAAAEKKKGEDEGKYLKPWW